MRVPFLVVAFVCGCAAPEPTDFRGKGTACRNATADIDVGDVGALLVVRREEGAAVGAVFGFGESGFVDTWLVAEVDEVTESATEMDLRGSFKTNGSQDSFEVALTKSGTELEGSLELVDSGTVFNCSVTLTPAE
jgi:hypothetical protein